MYELAWNDASFMNEPYKCKMVSQNRGRCESNIAILTDARRILHLLASCAKVEIGSRTSH